MLLFAVRIYPIGPAQNVAHQFNSEKAFHFQSFIFWRSNFDIFIYDKIEYFIGNLSLANFTSAF